MPRGWGSRCALPIGSAVISSSSSWPSSIAAGFLSVSITILGFASSACEFFDSPFLRLLVWSSYFALHTVPRLARTTPRQHTPLISTFLFLFGLAASLFLQLALFTGLNFSSPPKCCVTFPPAPWLGPCVVAFFSNIVPLLGLALYMVSTGFHPSQVLRYRCRAQPPHFRSLIQRRGCRPCSPRGFASALDPAVTGVCFCALAQILPALVGSPLLPSLFPAVVFCVLSLPLCFAVVAADYLPSFLSFHDPWVLSSRCFGTRFSSLARLRWGLLEWMAVQMSLVLPVGGVIWATMWCLALRTDGICWQMRYCGGYAAPCRTVPWSLSAAETLSIMYCGHCFTVFVRPQSGSAFHTSFVNYPAPFSISLTRC